MSDKTHKLLEDEQQIISTKEARKLLGKEFSSLSDEEVEGMIQILSLIARGVVTSEFSSI